MTTTKITDSRTASAFAILANGFVTAVRAVAASWTVFQNRRRLRALEDLDDYLLTDMGLTREDLREAYATPAHLDSSLRLAVLVHRHDRPATECRPRGRRGDRHVPNLGRTYP